jgi:hypothetical protein
MEIKLQTFRAAKKNDTLRHNGKEFVPFPLEDVIMPLKQEINLLNARINEMDQQHKLQIKQLLDLIKEINKNG